MAWAWVRLLLWLSTDNSQISNSRLDLTAPTRYGKTRRLLKEGTLMKAKSGRRLRAFLCSDILVLTEDTAKRLYRTVRDLSSLSIPARSQKTVVAYSSR